MYGVMANWTPLDPHPLDGLVQCSCGTPARLCTTKKANHNFNRQFFTCQKDRDNNTRCTFFKWADELSGPGAPAASQTGLASPPASQTLTGDLPDSSHPLTLPSTPSRANVNGHPATPRSASSRTAAQEVRRIALLEWSLATKDGPRPGTSSLPANVGAGAIGSRMSEQPTTHHRSEASTMSDLDYDEVASRSAPPLPPWPKPSPNARSSFSVNVSGFERNQYSKRKRDEDEESDDPFTMPSSSSPSAKRSLLGYSRIELLEKRLAEVEMRLNEQRAIIDQQTADIARQHQALQASETSNRTLQGRIDRLEIHVSTVEGQLKLHDQLLYHSSSESP